MLNNDFQDEQRLAGKRSAILDGSIRQFILSCRMDVFQSYASIISDQGKDYSISSLAVELANKEGVKLDDLAGIGSGEGKRILVYDVHRYIHPPQFKAFQIAKKLQTHLKASDIDRAFEKSYGSGQSGASGSLKLASGDSGNQAAQKDIKDGSTYVIPSRKGPKRKKGEVN